MEISFQHLAGCPNVTVAWRRFTEALGACGPMPLTIRRVEVASPQEADRLEFRGSPSFLIDGADPFAGESAPVGFACRRYRTEAGIEGAPSIAQLTKALSR